MKITKKQKKSLQLILITVVLTVICKLLPFGLLAPLGSTAQALIITACYLVPYLTVGYDILLKAVKNLFRGQMLDENTLMLIATVGAFVLQEPFEAVMVVTLYRIGLFFEGYATEKSRASIKHLMDIMPDYANVLRNGEILQVEPSEVNVGETIVVKAGERIPLDGRVLLGDATVNTSSLTGESVPLHVSVGDTVISGSINENGVIQVETSGTYQNSTVGKILDLVENAGTKKAKTENFISKFAAVYTPVVVAVAVLIAILPPIFGLGSFSQWVHRALTCLLISCPCALVISVPLSFFGGMGCASRQGILIKGAAYIERFAKVKTILFDKTGTLTKGSFKVVAVHPEKISENELLRLAAAVESYSNHPISTSLIAAYGSVPDDIEISEVSEVAGAGIRAKIVDKTIWVGNDKLMQQAGATYHNCHIEGTTVHVALENEYIGHIIISDEIKEDAKKAIEQLNALKLHTVMLTGDREKTAQAVCSQLGIQEFHAELLPADKADFAKAFIQKNPSNNPVAFVGDGINDAPVLMTADIGVSMGAMGSDAAIEAADVVIMDDSIEKLVTAKKISERTMGIVLQNIILSIGIKLVVLIISIFTTVPFELAEFADVGVLMLAVLNAARCLLPPRKNK